MKLVSLLRIFAALASGAVFGFGLSLSGMLDPVRVRGFLDVSGAWDPRLAFVLGGAVGVAILGTALSRRLRQPLLADSFHLPSATRIDRPLVIGSALFGIGWGIAGFCPGPAIAALSLGLAPSFLFVGAMLTGMIVHDHISRGRGRQTMTALPGRAPPIGSGGLVK